jgi:hypothetical protein
VDRLVANGIPKLTGVSAETLRNFAEAHGADRTDALLVINREQAQPSGLAPLLNRAGKPGFVVTDMTDVDDFAPTEVEAPNAAIYLVHDLDRGDHLANWSPAEAMPEIAGRNRSPLLLHEGIFWVLQNPQVLVEQPPHVARLRVSLAPFRLVQVPPLATKMNVQVLLVRACTRNSLHVYGRQVSQTAYSAWNHSHSSPEHCTTRERQSWIAPSSAESETDFTTRIGTPYCWATQMYT